MRHLFLLTILSAVSAVAQAFTVGRLTTEYTTTPLGIDDARPRFSWQMNDKTRGAAQTAYQISVSDEHGTEVWNSGKVNSSSSLNIHYSGKDLQPRTRYTWTVTVWNNAQQADTASATSWFETGLKSYFDNDKAWSGAQWIGGRNYDAYTFYSQYLPVFRLDATLQLDQKTKTTEAGLIYGANDIRLMDRNKNILGVENGRNESYVKVVLNIAPLLRGDSARIDIYRVGYTVGDKAGVPFASVKIPTTMLNKANCYRRHTIMLSSVNGTTNVWLDIWANKIVSNLNLNPMGRGSDYIAFPVVGDMGFYVPAGQKATFTTANVHNYRHQWHAISTVANNLTLSGKALFVTPEEHGAPMLRTEFATSGKQIAKARLYATARGVYEMFVNGRRVADDYLNPGLTQYNKTLYYQTYDVTPLLSEGRNALGAQLNEGWWSGGLTYVGDNWNFFGDRQSLLAQLVITYTDGTEQTVVTSPQTWKYTCDGPVRIGSLFQGEVYDATRDAAFSGWASAGYDDSAWRQAVTVPLEEVVSHEKSSWPTPDDYSCPYLVAQVGKPVRRYTTLTAQSVSEVRPGVYVYDMGQNMAGVPSITFTGLTPGRKVYMRYAEVLYPNLPRYGDNVGMVMMENQRAAMEQDIYVAKGGTETFSPRYTYHGYRYVEITGLPSPVDPASVKGIVLSSVDTLTAAYETSNADINRFFRNVEWSTLANVFSIPTDCPQRNERMGWSGDLSVFSPAMTYLFNGAEFLRRHLQALRDTQLGDGRFADIAPVGGGFGGPLWASVGVTVPWQSYLQYGDLYALAEHYPAMQKFIDLSLSKYIDKTDGYFKYNDGWGLGDWLGFEVKKNDNSLLFDCYLVHELDIMARAARALSKDADAARYEALRRQRVDFINAHFIDKATGKTARDGKLIDTQTSYALPIAFGIVDSTMMDKFVGNFVNSVTRESTGDDGHAYPAYSLMTGFIGTAWISEALTRCGHSDLAYLMLGNTGFPSWLYPVTQGATTIWERLNSYTKTDGFGDNNHMNSFNHYAFGSVVSWLMQRSLGIARDELVPAFKHFYLCPAIDSTAGGLTEARGHYDSMYGRIESCWHNMGNRLVYRCTVPANTSATLLLPAQSYVKKKKLYVDAMIDGKPFKEWQKAFFFEPVGDNMLKIELPAGEYDFEVTRQ